MTDYPERLRDLYTRANGMCVDYSLIREAADYIERLEQEKADAEVFWRENAPEFHQDGAHR